MSSGFRRQRPGCVRFVMTLRPRGDKMLEGSNDVGGEKDVIHRKRATDERIIV